MNIEIERQQFQFTIIANPRGVFLTIHPDAPQSAPCVDSLRFDSVADVLDWLENHSPDVPVGAQP